MNLAVVAKYLGQSLKTCTQMLAFLAEPSDGSSNNFRRTEFALR